MRGSGCLGGYDNNNNNDNDNDSHNDSNSLALRWSTVESGARVTFNNPRKKTNLIIRAGAGVKLLGTRD